MLTHAAKLPRVEAIWNATHSHARWQSYYVSRDGSDRYSGYWGTVTDPDGRVRQRDTDAERLQYVEDIAEELDFAASLPVGRSLDIGCGLGWFSQSLPTGWLRYGTDLCQDAAIKCSEAGITMLPADLRSLPTAAFDLVIMHHVIEHMRDPCGAMSLIGQSAKMGAWLILGTPDFFSPCAQRFGENYRLLHDETHVSLFSLESMTRLLTDYGWTVKAIRFPFPERYATAETMERWRDTSKASPPWPGNFMTFYAQRGG